MSGQIPVFFRPVLELRLPESDYLVVNLVWAKANIQDVLETLHWDTPLSYTHTNDPPDHADSTDNVLMQRRLQILVDTNKHCHVSHSVHVCAWLCVCV